MGYGDYQHLTFDLKPNGILLITINRPEPCRSRSSNFSTTCSALRDRHLPVQTGRLVFG
jgi:hypothetical protein